MAQGQMYEVRSEAWTRLFQLFKPLSIVMRSKQSHFFPDIYTPQSIFQILWDYPKDSHLYYLYDFQYERQADRLLKFGLTTFKCKYIYVDVKKKEKNLTILTRIPH